MPSPVDYLLATQHEKGGWGYLEHHRPVVEPTALALLAMRGEAKAANPLDKGIAWILNSQHKDGGWGIHEEDNESGWQTTWALIALRIFNQPDNVLTRGVDWLSHVGTFETTKEEFLKPDEISNDDPGALVWPWLPGQVCWIEPTALAALALEWVNQPVVAKRITAAREYFKKYRTPSGGWDIGNAGPLDTIVLPRAFPTAIVLMALAKIAPDDIQTDDLDGLRRDLEGDKSILSLSVGLLALRSVGGEAEDIATRITQRQLVNGSWENNPYYTAWATLALNGAL